ncbi:amidase [Methylobacterium gnaphalii]|uniref:Amidase n=1 Tax=Methylobacterium gnaphalii TaxID=1010610 RepID=A0A512JNG3_9HYPH|nr:amidase [Methylobacterium gnaphalii]GEP11496.1 amidase [Methylobacterium gnaphalii]GJD70170.1 Acylamidase [Methylobacterium gnaphalii]GLS49500.1 amidase [Methylobacterium gnaphalii]
MTEPQIGQPSQDSWPSAEPRESAGHLTRRSVVGALAASAVVIPSTRGVAAQGDPSLLDGGRLQAGYGDRSLSPVEVAKAAFARIDALNPSVNAFVFVDRDGAVKAAEASATRWQKGKPLGPLDGVPVTIKDNIPWAGHPTRKGSRTSADGPSPESAPVVSRLLDAGAVILGKTCMPEFGWKGVGDSPLSGITHNPWNTKVTTGGSTAGGAAAAALNLGVLHVGTDGAGSIRIPSSFCGVFGIKPSLGRIPAVPAAATLHVGPLSRSVRDAAALLQTIAGADSRDMTSASAPLPDLLGTLDNGVRDLRIAWSPRLGYVKNLDPEVEAITERAAKSFSDLGAKVEQADPGFPDPAPILDPIWLTICWTAVRSVPEAKWGELDPALLALAMKGRSVSAADYGTALAARASLHAAMGRFNQNFDLLLTPTLACPAFETGHNTPPDGRFGDDWLNWAPYTYPFNLSWHPAASVPCGFTKDGRPIGLQMVGPYLREDIVFRAARAYEQAHPWPLTDVVKRG